MEHAISLTAYRQQYWVRQHLSNLIILFAALTLFCAISFFIYRAYLNAQLQLNEQKTIIARNEQKITHLTDQETLLKNTLTSKTSDYLHTISINRFIAQLKQFPLNGGVEHIQFYHEQQDKMKITGKLPEIQFEQFNHYLKQHKIKFQVIHFQTNEKGINEFSLLFEQEVQ